MNTTTAAAPTRGNGLNIKRLVGSGEKIGLLLLPFLVLGVTANVVWPAAFAVGGPPVWLAVLSALMLVPGIGIWAWSVVLILIKVPRGELITTGPFRLVKHPLYTGVAFLVLPWAGFLLNTWLGLLLGIVLYIGSRLFSPAEERELAQRFGAAWDDYRDEVLLPWL